MIVEIFLQLDFYFKTNDLVIRYWLKMKKELPVYIRMYIDEYIHRQIDR